jgi:hypothetical protein
LRFSVDRTRSLSPRDPIRLQDIAQHWQFNIVHLGEIAGCVQNLGQA